MENENKLPEEVTEETVTAQEEVTEEPVNAPEEVTEGEIPQEPAPEPEKKKKLPAWKLTVSITAMVLVIAMLTGAVLFGMGYRWEDFFPENDIYLKDSYTVSDEKVAKAADQVVATVGDKKLTNGMLQLYYWLYVQGFMQNYAASSDQIDLYWDTPLDQQTCAFAQDQTWEQYFLQMALDNWSYHAMLNLMAGEDADYALDGEMLAYLDTLPEQMAKEAEAAGAQSYDELLRPSYGAGAKTENMVTYLKEFYKAMAYEAALAERFTPDQDELEAWYSDHEEQLEAQGIGKSAGYTVNVRHILIMPENGVLSEDGYTTTYSDEDWEDCRQRAQKVYDDWLAGDATEASFAAFAGQYSVDGSAENGGLYENVPKGYMVEPFENWIFDESRQVGDHGLVKTQYGYHVMYFSGSQEVWVQNATQGFMSEKMSAKVDEAIERWEVEVDYEKICLGKVDLLNEE